MTPTLATPLWAVRDAPLKSGRFPVIVYAPSFSSMSWENADLCEYLASHGYVVIASPDMGAMTRDMTGELPDRCSGSDISFLIGYSQTLPDTDMSEVAVAGFSWGGISNLFAAARDNRIDALVALDGSMRYSPGLVKQAGDVRPEQMTIPLLFFTSQEGTLEELERASTDKSVSEGPTLLNAWTHGDLITVHMLGLIHAEYSSMYQRNEIVGKDFPRNRRPTIVARMALPDLPGSRAIRFSFSMPISSMTRRQWPYLKKTPAENGVPRHCV